MLAKVTVNCLLLLLSRFIAELPAKMGSLVAEVEAAQVRLSMKQGSPVLLLRLLLCHVHPSLHTNCIPEAC